MENVSQIAQLMSATVIAAGLVIGLGGAGVVLGRLRERRKAAAEAAAAES